MQSFRHYLPPRVDFRQHPGGPCKPTSSLLASLSFLMHRKVLATSVVRTPPLSVFLYHLGRKCAISQPILCFIFSPCPLPSPSHHPGLPESLGFAIHLPHTAGPCTLLSSLRDAPPAPVTAPAPTSNAVQGLRGAHSLTVPSPYVWWGGGCPLSGTCPFTLGFQ